MVYMVLIVWTIVVGQDILRSMCAKRLLGLWVSSANITNLPRTEYTHNLLGPLIAIQKIQCMFSYFLLRIFLRLLGGLGMFSRPFMFIKSAAITNNTPI